MLVLLRSKIHTLLTIHLSNCILLNLRAFPTVCDYDLSRANISQRGVAINSRGFVTSTITTIFLYRRADAALRHFFIYDIPLIDQ